MGLRILDVLLTSGESVLLHLSDVDHEHSTWTMGTDEPVQLLRFDDTWTIENDHLLIWIAYRDALGISPVLADFGEVERVRDLSRFVGEADEMIIRKPDVQTWMPLLDGLPIASVPDSETDLRTGREMRWLRAIVVTGIGSRVQHTATDLAYWWAAGDWQDAPDDQPRWDAALVSIAHPELDHELLVLDCDEADAWVQCLRTMDRISKGKFRAEDLGKTD